ncbi:MAG: hypothetical protein HZB80_09110 [Deltaproteobacteria bacterium]|nr:hypothetical protein [Deltaproteobacteria bacterium]
MPKFFVDFEFAGHVEVEAQNEEKAKEIVEDMNLDKLAEHIQNFNVGRHYVEGVG